MERAQKRIGKVFEKNEIKKSVTVDEIEGKKIDDLKMKTDDKLKDVISTFHK